MTVWPVIVRELRAESRRPMNNWLRVLGAAVLVMVFAVKSGHMQGGMAQMGIGLFTGMNAALFGAIWVLGPLMTADCISREKREGTLGLLFLTPLSPFGIVLGKGLIHGWRALTLFLAMAPVLTVPC
ncbi:MAG: hypothetical protein M1608_13710 [Candidatus Omnitrophica bacterium]|nr:hypothetical protein [Candidatus Omnitrophota bacterium]